MRNRPIGLSDANYVILNEMRRELPGKKFESFDAVITRLIAKVKSKPAGENNVTP